MPSLLIVDDDRSVVSVFQRCFQHTDVTVHNSVSLPGAQGAMGVQPDVMVLHARGTGEKGLSALEEIRQLSPAVPVILVTSAAASDVAIESTRLGAMDFLTMPLDAAKVREVIGRAIHISAQIRLNGNGNGNHHAEAASAAAAPASTTLLGTSPAMQEVYKAIGRVAGQNINVLISGESGTGKELVARAIHQHSNRADKKFVAVNCAAIPESLLESELFGHEKGSFTGAVGQRIGRFEECDGGTLFLDEVGDMPLLMQSKVLRAIQEKEFQRVGGNQTITADVRIVAATNRDLEAMVLREEFRADLLFRLNGYHIALPGLRERREDIPLLAEHYLRLFDAELGTAITAIAPEALDLLVRHDWPGNVRELQTVLKHAMLHAIGPTLLPEFLPPELVAAAPAHSTNGQRDEPHAAPAADPARSAAEPLPPSAAAGNSPTRDDAEFRDFVEEQIGGSTRTLYADSVRYMESILLKEVLQHTNGNQSRAAAILGITRGCLRGKLRQHGIMISSSVAIRETGEGQIEPAFVGAANTLQPA
jgi:two-component system nitrogen regulation response regulator GlnG